MLPYPMGTRAMRRIAALLSTCLLVAASTARAQASVPPPNDSCLNAIAIGDGSISGATSGATNSINGCGLSGLAPDVWYSYTATSTGLLSLSTCGSSYDTSITLYASCTSTIQLACNDDAPQGAPCGYQSTDSYLTYPVSAGQVIKIRIAGFIGAQGAFLLETKTDVGQAFCLGDGVSATICPCSNTVAIGTPSGCRNSTGVGAKIFATGTAQTSLDTLQLQVDGVPAGASVMFFQGTTKQASGYGASFGDGVRCVGGTGIRLRVKTATFGSVVFPAAGEPRVSVTGMVPTSGGQRFYQAWYRNNGTFCTTATFNLTNGYEIAWAP